jgi:hypothetical protein
LFGVVLVDDDPPTEAGGAFLQLGDRGHVARAAAGVASERDPDVYEGIRPKN